MIVLDASAVIELLMRSTAGRELASRMFLSNETFHAPHLLDIEVAHVVRRNQMKGQLSEVRGRAILDDLVQLPLSRYPHHSLLPRIWALRDNCTAYDATYIALAETLDAVLVTRDRRLAAASSHRARVEVI